MYSNHSTVFDFGHYSVAVHKHVNHIMFSVILSCVSELLIHTDSIYSNFTFNLIVFLTLVHLLDFYSQLKPKYCTAPVVTKLPNSTEPVYSKWPWRGFIFIGCPPLCLTVILVSSGLHYLHAEAPVKVIHRDLKSRNGNTPPETLACLRHTISLLWSISFPLSLVLLLSRFQWWWQQTRCWRSVVAKSTFLSPSLGKFACFLHRRLSLLLFSDLRLRGV